MSQAGQVRIIGGQWRSRYIHFANEAQIRPTPDRVRETLFNWLEQDLTGMHCLDLFAGSGALGFEAASRGAERVVMIEQNTKTIHALRTSAQALAARQVKLLCMDARAFLTRPTESFDVIFLDPPFASAIAAEIMPKLPPWLTESGMLYIEGAEQQLSDDIWSVWKQGRTRHVHYSLLKPNYHG